MRYLKTYFYSENEIPMLLLNIAEAYDHIDKFIVYEFDYTTSGMKKPFVDLNKNWHIFEPYQDKFEYHKISLDEDPNFMKDESGNLSTEIQKISNEPYSRNYFTKLVSLNDEDLVFSVDADEIIYGSSYDDLSDEVILKDEPVLIKMHFFWQKINQLTPNGWQSSVACKFKHLKEKNQKVSVGMTKYPQWRNEGMPSKNIHGCHFSNCYAEEEQFEYRKKAIYYKPTTKKTISIDLDSDIIPKKLKEIYSVFKGFNVL